MSVPHRIGRLLGWLLAAALCSLSNASPAQLLASDSSGRVAAHEPLAPDGARAPADRVEGELIYRLATPAASERVRRRHGLRDVRTPVTARTRAGRAPVAFPEIRRARLAPGADLARALAALEADPEVAWAEPHYLRHVALVPSDPLYATSLGLATVHVNQGLFAAWDVTTGSRDVVVAIVDTGLDHLHEDLAANVWTNPGEIPANGVDDDANGFVDDVRGWDFVTAAPAEVAAGEDPAPPDADPMDVQGHGTHVAGIAGAHGGNGVGIAGVNWQVSLMALRAGYRRPDGGGSLRVSDIAAALTYACDNGAHVVNMSFGASAPSQLEREAIDHCLAAGVLLVAAAGNEAGDTPFYPAAFDGVTAVAALRNDRKLASFSNHGPWVDIASHGERIWSTRAGGGYVQMSGTSMAAPMVAGAAALLRAARPELAGSALIRTLQAHAWGPNAVNPPFVNQLGAGLPQVDVAISAASQPTRAGVAQLHWEELSGDDDGLPDPGESLRIRPGVRSWGGALHGLQVTLTTADPYVSVLDDYAFAGSAPADGMASWPADALEIAVAADAPEDHVATLTMEVSTPLGAIASDAFRVRLNPRLRHEVILERSTADPAVLFSGTGYWKPWLAAPGDGSLLLLYGDEGFEKPNEIFLRTRTPDGAWSDREVVSAGPGIGSAAEYDAALGSDGRLHLVFQGWVGAWDTRLFHKVRDAGGTWSPPVLVSAAARLDVQGLTGSPDAAVAIGSDGHPRAAWLDERSGTQTELRFARHDGTSWTADELVAAIPTYAINVRLFLDAAGDALALWEEGGGVSPWRLYAARRIAGAWSAPELLADLLFYPGHHAVQDATGVHVGYARNGAAVTTQELPGPFATGVWTAPVVALPNAYHGSVPVRLATAPGGALHTVRLGRGNLPLDHSELLEAVRLGSWAPAQALTFGAFDLPWTDYVLDVDGAGVRSLAARDGDEHLRFASAHRDESIFPSRPVVADDGASTANATALHASWSSAHASGIAAYRYAVGTAPGGHDIVAWSAETTAGELTIPLAATPMRPGQSYYVSVLARGGNGVWSPAGVSDGIQVPTPNGCGLAGPELAPVAWWLRRRRRSSALPA